MFVTVLKCRGNDINRGCSHDAIQCTVYDTIQHDAMHITVQCNAMHHTIWYGTWYNTINDTIWCDAQYGSIWFNISFFTQIVYNCWKRILLQTHEMNWLCSGQ